MHNLKITEHIQHKFQEYLGDNDLTQNVKSLSKAIKVFGVSNKAY